MITPGRVKRMPGVINLRALVDYGQILGRTFTVLTGLNFVRDLLAFVQGAESGAFDGRNVHERIFRTIVRLDEAITLSGIEPFNGAFSHIRILNHDVTGLPTRVVTGPVNVHTVRDN